jgi:DNA-binding NtrC family response regulator
MDVLIVEDDSDFRSTAAQWMLRKGHTTAEAENGRRALELARKRRFDVAILDLNLPDCSGLDLFQELRAIADDVEVVILTGEATVETAVEAMKRGACDFLSKPFPLAELELRCRKAAERGRLRRDSARWKTLAERPQPQPLMIGKSPAMAEIRRLIERVGPTEAPVLIQGETGTGKELAARAVQQASRRANQPFVTVNCAALPEQLVESELFGHEKGAFTGAQSSRPGLFEIADEGTLFIDEIGELPLTLQPKLLRVLEDGSLRRVGSSQERRVNVRIVAATNRDLAHEVEAGRFREDLLYRINVMQITLPSLRERTSDIPLLVQHFLGSNWEIDPEAAAAITVYEWPGNVRQLRNVLERARILAESSTITLDDLPGELLAVDAASTSDQEPACLAPEATTLQQLERAHIADVLQRCQGNKTQAARTLGIHRRKLYRLMERLDLAPGTADPQ